MRRASTTILTALLGLVVLAPAARAGYAGYVDPFAGTRPGAGTFGGGHNFPGASVPFGMVQWSPDTTPADIHGSGGYDYRDTHLRGFSLTHLSGAGCALYGDFPFLPTTEPLETSPAATNATLDGEFQPGFSHAGESARPGYYSVRLNPAHGGAIETELTATTRTGLGRFVFPSNPHANVLINAGGSAQPDNFAEVQVNPEAREISGAASSGLFCNQRPRYKVYFAAVFNRPFEAYGTWNGSQLESGSTATSATESPADDPATTAAAGAYATFDTTQNRIVLARVGVSFVSVEDARANLAAEDPGLAFGTIAARAQHSWNDSLGRIRVSGGSRSHLETFYTALYHAFLAPRTFSDVNGDYIGMDGLIHNAGTHIQYADFSGWDIYRSEVQLLSLLAPRRASDMVRSLLEDAAQSGCLPRWPYANGQSMEMIGDPADPIIASAAAFGATGFDKAAALAAMVKGASEPCHSTNAEYVERQGLSAYQELGYVPYELDTNTRNANSINGSPEAVWASAATSLEYDIDDFAIAQFAARYLHQGATYAEFIRRSGQWRRLYEPHDGMIEPRYASGEFPSGYNVLDGGGFAEGDSAQYTWLVPQDPAGLFRRMGGRARATARLHYFLRVLNAGEGGTHTSHALLGDEPTIQTPWLYDWLGQPYRTQEAVRRGLTLFSPTPDGYPGNDDLGTLSAWYVFGALGLYPEVPGVGVLALSSPLFPRAEVRLGNGRRLLVQSSGHGFYVQSLRLNGHLFNQPWTTYCALSHGATLSFQLGRRPDRRWGAGGGAVPPSFGPQRSMPQNACRP